LSSALRVALALHAQRLALVVLDGRVKVRRRRRPEFARLPAQAADRSRLLLPQTGSLVGLVVV
jgi:cell division protein FtsL